MENQVIEQFLAEWKEAARSYYLALGDEYKALAAEARKTGNFDKLKEWADGRSKAEYEIVSYKVVHYPEDLEPFLVREVNAKRKNLISRIEKKAGKIKDARYLTIGKDGNINGQVVGEKATVYVETISAGGHTIQKFHYRVLVK